MKEHIELEKDEEQRCEHPHCRAQINVMEPEERIEHLEMHYGIKRKVDQINEELEDYLEHEKHRLDGEKEWEIGDFNRIVEYIKREREKLKQDTTGVLDRLQNEINARLDSDETPMSSRGEVEKLLREMLAIKAERDEPKQTEISTKITSDLAAVRSEEEALESRRLAGELEVIIEERDRLLEASENGTSNRVEKLTTRVKELQAERNQLRWERDGLQLEKEDLQAGFDTSSVDRTPEPEVSTIERVSHPKTPAKLRAELAELRAERDAMCAALDAPRDMDGSVNGKKLRAEIERLQAERNELVNERDELEFEVDSVLAQLTAPKPTPAGSEDMDELRAELEKVQVERDDLEYQRNNLQARHDDLKAELEELKTGPNSPKANQEMKKLRVELREVKFERDKLKRTANVKSPSQQTNNGALRQALQELRKENEDLQSSLAKTLSRRTSSSEAKPSEIDEDTAEELDRLRVEIDGAKRERDEAMTQRDLTAVLIVDLEGENQKLQDKLDKAHRSPSKQLTKYYEELAKAKAKIEELVKRLETPTEIAEEWLSSAGENKEFSSANGGEESSSASHGGKSLGSKASSESSGSLGKSMYFNQNISNRSSIISSSFIFVCR